MRFAPRLLASLLLVSGLLTTPSLAEPASVQDQQADTVLPSIDKRFVKDLTTETPDFQKHVAPLLGKLGCNSRACHGSFAGQGGFQLSLFGYDFKMDHDNLMKGEAPRVDLADPDLSLFLQKPTLNYPHEGGKRMDEDSWEYRVFLQWVKKGAPYLTDDKPTKLARLEVTPSKLVFDKKGESVALKAVAVWADGTREDVTPLCRFQVNDDQIADVTSTGVVTGKEPGDSHIVAFYDTAVVPVPVMRPVSDRVGKNYPRIATSTRIDELVQDKLSTLGIIPSEQCTDGEFLRRVSLDLTGTLPTADEARAFLQDTSPNKRARKIEELLESPAYAAWWTTRLCDWTGNNDYELRNTTPNRSQPAKEWYEWIYKRVENNTPYDDLVEGIVMGNGREGNQSFEEYCKEMSDLYRPNSETSFADRDTMQWFWARRNLRQPEEKALSFAYTFMGIRIQCAQCHKHPFDQWSQDDYNQFTKFFTNVQFGTEPSTRQASLAMQKNLGLGDKKGNDLRRALPAKLKTGAVIPFQEVYTRKAVARKNNNSNKNSKNRRTAVANASAKLLGDEVVDLTSYDDPRKPLMDWLRKKDNPYFAKAFVNRVWANYFNVGIVSPPDDLSLANPPSNKPLLDYLANGFIESGYDMKWLHRTIVMSDTYQRSWKPNETNTLDERNFSRAVPRRLPAEVAYDAILFATASDEAIAEYESTGDGRAIRIAGSDGDRGNYGSATYALNIFGRSVRESNCDCDRSAEPSLLQTIYLRNDADLSTRLVSKNGWLREIAAEHGLKAPRSADVIKRPSNYEKVVENYRTQIAKAKERKQDARVKSMQKNLRRYLDRYGAPEGKPDSADSSALAQKTMETLVEEAYLRTLTRFPSEQEVAKSVEYLSISDDKTQGLQDLLWALLNTKEFIVNH